MHLYATYWVVYLDYRNWGEMLKGKRPVKVQRLTKSKNMYDQFELNSHKLSLTLPIRKTIAVVHYVLESVV